MIEAPPNCQREKRTVGRDSNVLMAPVSRSPTVTTAKRGIASLKRLVKDKPDTEAGRNAAALLVELKVD